MKLCNKLCNTFCNKQWIIVAVVAIVAIPWGVAWWTAHHSNALNLEAVTHGDLFTTQVETDDFDFHDTLTQEPYYLDKHWWLLLVQKGSDQECLNRLHDLHQIHVALAKEGSRVKRALVQVLPTDVVDKTIVLPADKALVRLRITPDQLIRFREGVDESSLDFEHGVVYVVDPLGNVVMAFDAKIAPKDVLSDVKRLLRGSHIG